MTKLIDACRPELLTEAERKAKANRLRDAARTIMDDLSWSTMDCAVDRPTGLPDQAGISSFRYTLAFMARALETYVEPIPAPTFKKGDRVTVTALSSVGVDRRGEVGEVVSTSAGAPEGWVNIVFPSEPRRVRSYLPSQVELAIEPVAQPWEPKVGEWVRTDAPWHHFHGKVAKVTHTEAPDGDHRYPIRVDISGPIHEYGFPLQPSEVAPLTDADFGPFSEGDKVVVIGPSVSGQTEGRVGTIQTVGRIDPFSRDVHVTPHWTYKANAKALVRATA